MDGIATLEAVVERLVAGYDPDRIILFGSCAAGATGPESDIDLLIVKDTDRRPIERRLEVEGLLSGRAVALDLHVYTPREMRELYAAGDPFIEEVVERGRVVYMRAATAAWVREAQDELESAAILLEHGKLRGACLHSQQCAEKALKAMLLEKAKRPPRTHDVVELRNAVAAEGWAVGLETDDAVFLSSVYRGRYPTEAGLLPHGEPSEADARRALGAARAVLEGAKALLEPRG